MCHLSDLEIKNGSRTPKYKQVVSEINNKIEKGMLLFGEKLPSINELSENYLLSRNTVEKAYIQLKESGIVDAVKGKGYYVKNTNPISKVRVMLLFNKLSNYKKIIYDTITNELEGRADVDLFIFNAEFDLFRKLLIQNRENYHYFMVMPHFRSEDHANQLTELLSSLPKDKLIILDKKLEYFKNPFGNIYQDFKMDIYDALYENLNLIKKFQHLILVFPDGDPYPYPKEILHGFRRFCVFNNFEFEIINKVSEDFRPMKGEGVITISDDDLITLIKNMRRSTLKMGREYGIISYNDLPFKEILENGITVLTTDFEKMGHMAAEMILDKEGRDIKNPFKLIDRGSY